MPVIRTKAYLRKYSPYPPPPHPPQGPYETRREVSELVDSLVKKTMLQLNLQRVG